LLRAIQTGATVDVLPLDYSRADCSMLRLDSAKEVAAPNWSGASLVAADQNPLFLALTGPGLEKAHPAPSAHGGVEALLPSPELRSAAEDTETCGRRGLNLASALAERTPD